MMTPDEFTAAWGEDLVLLPPASLADMDVPMNSKLFLAEGGLPRQAPLPSNCQGLHLLPPEAPPDMLPGADEFRLLEKKGRFWLLGIRWYYSIIALDGDGRIVTHSAQALRRGRAFIMNSSVSQFAEMLLVCRTSKDRFGLRWPFDSASFLAMSKTPEYRRFMAEALAETDWLEGELQRIDPAALAHPNSYWPGVLEDLRQL